MARLRAVRAQKCAHPAPHVTTVNGQVFVSLDWSDHQTGGNLRCRLCQRPTLLVDCAGRPCHKTCAENETARDLQAAGDRYTANAAHTLS
ncbi:hypothetical protein [Micromonospora haikouensis]|uniref:hypothetical protein n=1 Tax=Micromonospora haikouensis TaxID=686309 RepID=UPI003D72EB15